jgi:hypothetical protein
LGITLPASFFEWYGMRDGLALLRGNSNDDEPIDIGSLGAPIQWRWPQKRDLVQEGLLPFMVENQGVEQRRARRVAARLVAEVTRPAERV